MHEFKIQEKLTTKKIEYDLKRTFGRGVVFISAVTVFLSAFIIIPIIVIANDDPVKHEGASKYLLIASLVLLGLMLLLLWVISAHSIYMRLFGYKRFKIGIDTFTGFEIMQDWGPFVWFKDVTNKSEHNHNDNYEYFKFARFGRYVVGYREWYYTWSENYKTLGHELEDSFRVGERVYVVLVGKRIKYVYNDKMFELSETLMKERLIDDVELHKMQKQAERESDENT